MGKNRHTPITPAQRAARRRNAAKASEASKKAAAARRAESAKQLAAARVPPLAVSQARREAARAELAEIEVQEKRRQLVAIEEARAVMVEKFTVVKTRLLGLPARVKQRLPHVAADDVRVIDDLVREALEELADGDTGGE